MNWNVRLFFKINSLVGRYRWLDVFGWFGAELAIFLMLAVYIVYLFFNFSLYPIGESIPVFIIAWIIGFLLSLLIGYLVKSPRPYITHPEQVKKKINTLFGWKSFPSDHSMTAFLILFLSIGNPLAWIFLALALLVGFGRVFTGVHYPLDVIGGAFVAYISMHLANLILFLF